MVIVVLLTVVVTVLSVIVIWNCKSPKSYTVMLTHYSMYHEVTLTFLQQKDGPAPPNTYEPSPPTNDSSVPLFNRVLSDGGNYDTVIDMAGGPPPPPHTAGGPPPVPLYSLLSRPGTTRSTGVGMGDQMSKAVYSTPAEVSDSVNRQVATDEQGNHPDIEHEEINVNWLFMVLQLPDLTFLSVYRENSMLL